MLTLKDYPLVPPVGENKHYSCNSTLAITDVLSKGDSSVITWNFFPQGLEIVFRVGLAILQMNQAELIQLDMEGMLQVYITMTSWSFKQLRFLVLNVQRPQGRNLHHTHLIDTCILPTCTCAYAFIGDNAFRSEKHLTKTWVCTVVWKQLVYGCVEPSMPLFPSCAPALSESHPTPAWQWTR